MPEEMETIVLPKSDCKIVAEALEKMLRCYDNSMGGSELASFRDHLRDLRYTFEAKSGVEIIDMTPRAASEYMDD
uniref:Uncharacterized protein n=1 Tax=viral metagenome TaxID=1070528 RepID=A0A6H1Z9B0_9ZZZZ